MGRRIDRTNIASDCWIHARLIRLSSNWKKKNIRNQPATRRLALNWGRDGSSSQLFFFSLYTPDLLLLLSRNKYVEWPMIPFSFFLKKILKKLRCEVFFFVFEMWSCLAPWWVDALDRWEVSVWPIFRRICLRYVEGAILGWLAFIWRLSFVVAVHWQFGCASTQQPDGDRCGHASDTRKRPSIIQRRMAVWNILVLPTLITGRFFLLAVRIQSQRHQEEESSDGRVGRGRQSFATSQAQEGEFQH